MAFGIVGAIADDDAVRNPLGGLCTGIGIGYRAKYGKPFPFAPTIFGVLRRIGLPNGELLAVDPLNATNFTRDMQFWEATAPVPNGAAFPDNAGLTNYSGHTLQIGEGCWGVGGQKNLAAWYRLGVGITTAAGGAVSQWDDASGNGRHLKQAVAASRPLLQPDGSILFDGVDDFLKADAFTLDQPETVYFLGKQVSWTINDRLWDGNVNDVMAAMQTAVTPSLRIIGSTLLTTDNPGLAVGTYGVLSAVFNSTNSLLQVSNNAPVTGNAGTANASGFTLGGRGGGANSFANIQVKEVLVFSGAQNATARAKIIAYLLSK